MGRQQRCRAEARRYIKPKADDGRLVALFGDGGGQDALLCTQIKTGVVIKGETKRFAGAIQGLFHQSAELLGANDAFDRDAPGGLGCSGDRFPFGLVFDRTHDRFFMIFGFRFGHVASLLTLFGAAHATTFAALAPCSSSAGPSCSWPSSQT